MSNGQHPAEKPNATPLTLGIENGDPSQKTVRVLAFLEGRQPTTGPAKNLLEFARRSAAKKNPELSANIAIASFCRGAEPPSHDLARACEKNGLEFHVLRERFLFDLSVIPAIRNLVALCKPDIIESHAVKSHFLISFSGVNRERPWIAFHHGYIWTSAKSRLYNYLDRWSLLAATKVVTDCQAFASDLEEMGVRRERIVIQHSAGEIFSPASNEEVFGLRQTLRIPMDTPVVLCVGRLSAEKAQADLIKAAALLRRDHAQRSLQFVIAGEGPDQQMLKNLARSCHVEDWFIFTGYVSDVRPYYSLANLLVVPSHTEGSPNVLLEAMAAGLPIVATAVGGVPEIVTNEREALLVEKHNPLALARAIGRLLSDADLQRKLGEAARQAVSTYSPAAYCDSILSVYQNCLALKNVDSDS